MIIFFDPKSGRGGGQVVLEDLVARLVGVEPVGLVMPDAGRAQVSLSDEVVCWSTPSDLIASPAPGPLLLVSNANASLGQVWRAAATLRRRGMEVRTAAIVHNYPSTQAKKLATRGLLSRLELAIVVEPGLCALRADSLVPPWLSVTPRSLPRDHRSGISRTGTVKSYARPDPSKGMHLLSEVFETLTAAGIRCEVALGDALDGQVRYEQSLRRQLAPWLVSGKRTADWIQPGDIFVVPSVSGEAACLAAQEAMSGGAYVVASRLGLMPYLSPTGSGVSTFATGSSQSAITTIQQALELDEQEFSLACQHNVATIAERAGRWQDYTIDVLRSAVRTRPRPASP